MGGLLDFVKQNYSFRNAISITTTYTILVTDEFVNFLGTSAATVTLPDMTGLAGKTFPEKTLLIQNNGTAVLTLAAATAIPTQTVDSRSTLVLNPGQWVLLEGGLGKTDWVSKYPAPAPVGGKNIIPLIATSSGTTPINICGASGAIATGIIVAIVSIAQDTNAGNIIVKNGTNTVATIAKSTTAGLPVGDSALANTNVTAGNVLTVESSTTNGNAKVIVWVETQQMNRQL